MHQTRIIRYLGFTSFLENDKTLGVFGTVGNNFLFSPCLTLRQIFWETFSTKKSSLKMKKMTS
uniref:Putative ovule protein n=1 Tax=Solanum chacoense TaxID=4108 RepID=A0A0V0GNB2_SOLCH